MKFVKIVGTVGLIGCITCFVLCITNHINFGSWDILAFIGGIVFFGAILSMRSLVDFLCEKFDVSYSKDKGLSVSECKKCNHKE